MMPADELDEIIDEFYANFINKDDNLLPLFRKEKVDEENSSIRSFVKDSIIEKFEDSSLFEFVSDYNGDDEKHTLFFKDYVITSYLLEDVFSTSIALNENIKITEAHEEELNKVFQWFDFLDDSPSLIGFVQGN